MDPETCRRFPRSVSRDRRDCRYRSQVNSSRPFVRCLRLQPTTRARQPASRRRAQRPAQAGPGIGVLIPAPSTCSFVNVTSLFSMRSNGRLLRMNLRPPSFGARCARLLLEIWDFTGRLPTIGTSALTGAGWISCVATAVLRISGLSDDAARHRPETTQARKRIRSCPGARTWLSARPCKR